MTRVAHALKLALLALVVTGCGGPDRIGKPLVWPPPPATGRIQFVTAFSNTEHLSRSRWANFKRDVFGGSGAFLAQPTGLALSADGRRLYIADRTNRAILVADFDKKELRVVKTKKRMGLIVGVALDADENIYVTDPDESQVLVFNKAGKELRAFGQDVLVRPTGIVVDTERDRIYVSSTGTKPSPRHLIAQFDMEGKHVRNVAVRGREEGQVFFPTYLALDPEGNLYVADTLNFRIQKFGPDGEFIGAFGKNGDGPGTFSRIKGIAIDRFGSIYVVDAAAQFVQMFNKNFDLLMWFGGKEKYIEHLELPTCIAIDPKTDLIYVCNNWVARINVYKLINTNAEDVLKRSPVQGAENTGKSEAADTSEGAAKDGAE